MQKPFTTHADIYVDINGCSLKGYLDGVTRSQMTETFGDPLGLSCDGKTTHEWSILFPCGTVAAVYDWKGGARYHVGGHSIKALWLVQAALAGRTYKYECLGETLSKAEALGWKNALDDIEVNDDTDPDVIDSVEADALEAIADAGWIVYGMDGGVA
jgi:hypothetical protein